MLGSLRWGIKNVVVFIEFQNLLIILKFTEVSLMEPIEYWGYLASIATCVSLLIYIFGNLIAGLISFIYANRYNNELFVWNPDKNILRDFYIVREEIDETQEDRFAEIEELREPDRIEAYNSIDKLLIASNEVLINIKAYSLVYKNDRPIKNKELFSYDRLSPRESILFVTFLPEGCPSTVLEWETPNFMRATLYVSYNGKDGNICENIRYAHTFKSFIYYLFNK